MTLKELIVSFYETEKQIHERFGFERCWRAFPIEENLEQYWFIVDDDRVVYNDKLFTKENIESETFYCHDLGSSWELKNGVVWRAEGFVMVLVDTNVDENVFLMIFDEAKECKDRELIDYYKEQ